MLRFPLTLALFFWYYLLLHSRALADEEAAGELTPSSKNSPEEKSSIYSWFPSIPKLPSLTSFGLFGSSGGKNEDAVSTTTAKGVTELISLFQDHTGSGEGSNFEESQQTTTLTQWVFMSVAEIRTDPPPTRTSDLPYSSISQSNSKAFVTPTSSYIRNTLFTNSPNRSNTPKQNITSNPTPWSSTTEITSSPGATEKPRIDEESIFRDNIFSTQRTSSTRQPQTTVPTALTWKTVRTTTPNPGLVETSHFVREQETLAVSVALHSIERTSEIHSTQSHWNLGLSETSLANTEQQPGLFSTILKTDPTMVEGTISEINPTQNSLDLGVFETNTVNVEQQPEVLSAPVKTDHNLEVERTSEMYLTKKHLHLGFETTMVNPKQESEVFSSTVREAPNLVVESTTAQIQTTLSHLDLGFSETRTVNAEQQSGAFSTTLRINHNSAVESIPSTTHSQRDSFPIAEGKQI